MSIYTYKRRWKWFLVVVATIIIFISLWFTNILVSKIASDERNKVELWAQAVQNKALLVQYTEELFKKMQDEERIKMQIWANATKKLIYASENEDLSFYTEIISGNTNIPVILTNDKGLITQYRNINLNSDTTKYLEGKLKGAFSQYPPIIISYGKKRDFLYYKDSKVFEQLKNVMQDIITSFISEVAMNSASVPVVIVDSTKQNLIAMGNIDTLNDKNYKGIRDLLNHMQEQNTPIKINLAQYGTSYVFYQNSRLLTYLKYYPIAQIGIIGFFVLISYLLFSMYRRAEQNQVWAGMAKETAHQLGTPLSSLLAWVEILKLKEVDDETITELGKDIKRLETITQRFSNIGSAPKMENSNIIDIITSSVDYIKRRSSSNVHFHINTPHEAAIYASINNSLFEWVVENLCRNAVDAMGGKGFVQIDIAEDATSVLIDVTDTGKGISKSKFKTVFNPGYTTKQRGWGLGLTLSRRIIENYHKGRIFVKQSVIGKGTTFRIVLKKRLIYGKYSYICFR